MTPPSKLRPALLPLPLLLLLLLVLGAEGSADAAGFARLLGGCARERGGGGGGGGGFDCLKRRALDILEGAIEDGAVYEVNEYLAVGRDEEAARGLMAARNSSADATTAAAGPRSLDEELERRLGDYIGSRSIRLTIPGAVFEGRGKKGKKGSMGGLMMGGLAMAGMLAQLAFGKIAFLAGTALLTAKIALVLSAIIGLKKLVSGGDHGGGHEVIYAAASEHHPGGGYGGGWQRAFVPGGGVPAS